MNKEGGMFVLCEECMKNEATVAITITTGDEATTRHLCPECMKKMELSLSQGDIQSFLSSILSVLGSKKAAERLTCGGCGLSYAEFERTGKLGCAQCYRDFSEQLKPLLQRIHGCTQHAGHRPESMPAPAIAEAEAEARPDEGQKQLDGLRQKMEQAVASENFEDAAKYRDEIRALTECGEANRNP